MNLNYYFDIFKSIKILVRTKRAHDEELLIFKRFFGIIKGLIFLICDF